MDDLWNIIVQDFDSKILKHLPYHSGIIKTMIGLINGDIDSSTNIMLYGPTGFPMHLLWETMFYKITGKRYIKSHVMWQNAVSYYETPYFFEIDMSDPHQPKDVEVMSNFLKEIIQHPCVFNTRHIIVIKNLDKTCVYKSGFSFRVLLERFSSNVLFICATKSLGVIERPIVSRCIGLRVPLATNDELGAIFGDEGLGWSFHPFLKTYNCRDFYFAVYIHWLSTNLPQNIHEEMFKYRVQGLNDLLKRKTEITIEDIRTFTAKICVHDISIQDLTNDILQNIRNVENKHKFALQAAKIEHLCACTEQYRKPLYVELLLNIAILGLNNKHLPHNFMLQ